MWLRPMRLTDVAKTSPEYRAYKYGPPKILLAYNLKKFTFNVFQIVIKFLEFANVFTPT